MRFRRASRRGSFPFLMVGGIVTSFGCGTSSTELQPTAVGPSGGATLDAARDPSGSCPSDGSAHSPVSFPDIVTLPGSTWFELDHFDEPTAAIGRLADSLHIMVRPTATKVYRSGSPPGMKVPERYARVRTAEDVSVPTYVLRQSLAWAHREMADGATILLGVAPTPHDEEVLVANGMFAIRQDGTVVSLDPCGANTVEPLLRSAASKLGINQGESALLIQLIREGSGGLQTEVEKALALAPPKPWESTSPDERQVDSQSTPTELFSKLKSTRVIVSVPKEWGRPSDSSSFDALCVKSSVGWGTCAILGDWVHGTIELVGYTEPNSQPGLNLFINRGWRFDSTRVPLGDLSADAEIMRVTISGGIDSPQVGVLK